MKNQKIKLTKSEQREMERQKVKKKKQYGGTLAGQISKTRTSRGYKKRKGL